MRGLKLLSSMLNEPPDNSVWAWATVTDDSPLRVQLDSDDAPLDVTPDTLVPGLVVDDRVWVQLVTNVNPLRRYRRVVITGKASSAAGAARMGCTLVRSTAQSAGDGSNTVISWSSASYDPQDMWTTGTNIDIPANGLWAATFRAVFSGAIGSGRAYLALEITGGPLWRMPFAGSGETIVTQSIVAPMSAGNVLTAKALQTSGGSLDINPAQIDVYRIGA